MTTEHKIIIGGLVITFVMIVGISFLLSNNSSGSSSVSDDQIVAQNGIHWHPKLTITIKGKKQEFANGIGLTGNVHQKMHTHDEDYKDGVVHMEMQGVVTKEDTKIGNFFKIWRKEFSSTKIFDKSNGNDGKVTMLVNGKENSDFENYKMHDGDKIEISYK